MTGDRNLVLGTAGHIDHGKTALVRALTGVDTDRLPAEKKRGITIDLGFAALQLGSGRLAMVDVPGHERFIRNMLAGATGFDLAMLVVAADDSVMPQTREHLEILRLLGIPRGLVALTKCDLADAAWLDLVEADARELTAGTFLEGAPIVRTSASTGLGIDTLKEALASLCRDAPGREDPGVFRMAIDRSFSLPGLGTIVTGTVASGSAGVGDDLQWFPEGRTVRVRGLHQHDRPTDRVGRGARAAINLANVHHAEVHRGHELGAPGYLMATRVLSVEVRPSPDAPRPPRHRARYRLHMGTADLAVSLALLEPERAAAGVPALAQLTLAEPVAAVFGQPFILREESPPTTLGGGRVLQPTARRIRRRDREALDRLDRLRSADPDTRIGAALAATGLEPPSAPALSRMTGLPVVEVAAVLGRLSATGAVVEVPLGPRRSAMVAGEFAAELEGRVLRALGRLHAARPRQSTIPRSHLAAELPNLGGEALVAGLVDRLRARGLILGDGRSLALRDHVPKLSQGERRLKDEIAGAFRDGGLSPPDAADLGVRGGRRAAVIPELLALLVEEAEIVDLGHGLHLGHEAEAVLRRRVASRLADGSGITMSGLRDLLGTTRKYAVPIGEYLDRIGLTVREGDVRKLGPAAERPEAPG